MACAHIASFHHGRVPLERRAALGYNPYAAARQGRPEAPRFGTAGGAAGSAKDGEGW
jgi:hypothetical protein